MIPFPFQFGGAGIAQQQAAGGSGISADVVGSLGFTTAATSHLVPISPGINAGDLLIAIVGSDGSSTNSVVTASGFTQPSGGTQDITGVSARATVLYKTAAGTEGGTSIDFQTVGSEEAAVIVLRVPVGAWQGTPEVLFAPTGSSNIIALPTLSPTWGGAATLWVGALFKGRALGISAYPYAGNNTAVEGMSTSTTGASAACCTVISSASSSPAGSFTCASNQNYGVCVVAVRPLP